LTETTAQTTLNPSIEINDLGKVRQEALKQGVSVIQILEETYGQSPVTLIAQLGQALRMPVLKMETLRSLKPAFDILPFPEAAKHECALFRKDDEYLLAVSDPFSPKLRSWVEERFDVGVLMHLVHPADLSAYFTQQEQSMRAMDNVLSSAELNNIEAGIEDLSLKSINEGTSQVVRLVHSTLYDAHKSQASDIHLEMVMACYPQLA
jgi:general secretion pathway protein E